MAIESRSDRFVGIYEVPEAARLLRATMPDTQPAIVVSSRKIIRWIRRGLSSHDLTGIPGRGLLINFEDLVSMRVIAALRAAGVTFPKIHSAEEWLRQHTGAERPFATQLLWTEHSEVFIEFGHQLVAASRAGQYALDLLRSNLIPVHGLVFGPECVAVAWRPAPWVWIDPQIQFGAPCVEGTRIPTRTLWSMIKAGDSVENVAHWHGLDKEVVERAFDWENTIAA